MTLPIRPFLKTVITMPTPTIVDGKPVGWVPTSVVQTVAGLHVVYMYPKGGSPTEVTYFRGVPLTLENYSFVDPFTYGTAVITFPQITIFDDLDALGFLGTEDNPANVDIWFFPMVAGSDFINPLTQQKTLTYGTGTRVWEGFIASREIKGDEDNSMLQVQCQGALFELDGYKQKPFFPRRPYRLEGLMFENTYPVYSPGNQGHYFGKSALRTLPLITRWPTGWTKVIPDRLEGEPNLYTPVGAPGRLCTGFTTRNTGTWDPTLTGYFQEMLAIMYTTDDSGPGVTPGEQWTLRCESPRQPVLEVRSRTRTPDFELWAGQPGVQIDVTEDNVQIENSIYGEGTGEDGTTWRNAYFTGAWNRTAYEPLANDDRVYPDTLDGNALSDHNVMVHEAMMKFGAGMNLAQGILSSEKRLELAKTAGLAGSMTFRVDPSSMTRWEVKAGMTVLIKGIRGSGATGIRFHIAEVVINVTSQTVTCKIDTKYRDLLTLEQVRARNIDPMTPSKLLQVNKKTAMIEDILAPWDYHAGSGYIPKTARYGKSKRDGHPTAYDFFGGKPESTHFPWESWTRAHPPSSYTTSADGYTKGPYVRAEAGQSLSRNRWAFVEVLTAAKGTIRRIEVACYDGNGNVLAIPFHLSLYYNHVGESDMPHDGSNYDPLNLAGAFESYNSAGILTPDLAPDESIIIGWGNSDQPAGHSPGSASQGFPATGLLIDESTWSFDNTTNPMFDTGEGAEEEDQRPEAVTINAALFANSSGPVYFLGRMYRQEQGGNP